MSLETPGDTGRESMSVEWPMTLPSFANARMHWTARHRLIKKQRVAVGLALRANGVGWRLKPVGEGKLVVHLTRVAPRPIRDVHDNLRSAFKGIVDEVAAFFHIDDSDPRIEWQYAQARGRSSVRIKFEVSKKSTNEGQVNRSGEPVVSEAPPDAVRRGAARAKAGLADDSKRDVLSDVRRQIARAGTGEWVGDRPSPRPESSERRMRRIATSAVISHRGAL